MLDTYLAAVELGQLTVEVAVEAAIREVQEQLGNAVIMGPTGERGGLENHGIGLFVATIAGSVCSLSVAWRTSSLRRGLLLALIRAVLVSSSLKNCHVK